VHFYFASNNFNRFISSFKIEIDPRLSSLMTALFFISFAHCANFNVERVSPNEFADGEMFAMMSVLEFPPRESQSKKVSFESR